MFQPNFNYNHKMVNTLLEINSIRDFILNAPLIVEVEISLKRDALLKSAHYSTAIEGNPLSLSEVDKLSRGMEVLAQKKAKQEVLNYLNVLKNLDKYSENGKITEKSILKLHRDVTYHTLDYTYLEGEYRTIPVHVVNKMGEVVYTPPRPHLIASEMKAFVEWLNYNHTLNPVLVAGVAHYELVRIHPFVDGNGRTARALVALLLFLKKFHMDGLFTLDEYYDQHRANYYAALHSADSEDHDLTEWLEYFLEGFLFSIKPVKDQLLVFTDEVNKRQVKLTRKQMKILEFIHLNGQITNAQVKDLFNMSRQGSYKVLRGLMDLNLIEKKGGSRSTYYVQKRLSNK